MTTHRMRNPGLVAYSLGRHLHLLRPGHPETVIGPVDTTVITDLLAGLIEPVDAATFAERVDDATADHLVRRGIVLEGTEDELRALLPTPRDEREPVCGNLLLGVSGSIVARHAPSALAPLLLGGATHTDVIVTAAAARFVSPDAFAWLGAEVWTDDFVPRTLPGGERVTVPHIHLARTADLVVVWPASASTLAKLATGACNDLLSLAVTATRAPVVLFPAMNHDMWTSPAVARNVAQLRADGMVVVEPEPGRAAADLGNGELGIGAPGGGGVGLTDLLRSVVRATRPADG